MWARSATPSAYGLDGAVSSDVLREAMKAIAADLSCIADRPQPETLVAMGGAVTNLTAVSYAMARYDPDKIQGTVLARDEIDRQIELYRTTRAGQARRNRRPPAKAGRRHPGRRLHRPHGDGAAGQA